MNQVTAWDAVIIGSGLGSLSAAAALAKRGKRVLVLERLANFGGAATIYRHGSLTMEASLHETDGDTVYGPNSVFAKLDLVDAVEPIKTDYFYEVRSPVLPGPIQVPRGLDNAREVLKRLLPDARHTVDSYFGELASLCDALRDLENTAAQGPSTLLGLVFSGSLFTLIGDARQTLAHRFNAVFGDDEAAKLALGAPIVYFDDDPAKLSFLLFAGVWARYAASGSFYFRGGSRALTMALLERIKDAGGEARHHQTVVSILVDSKNRAVGVVYENQQGESFEAHAPLVFAGAAPEALAWMLPKGPARRLHAVSIVTRP